ncbi:tetratricopeptide repeat protein [Stratiformator vulcanicus]|uniref:Anaphase-promoting complex, cyclosome, subunit 3 n=1 Tax=Stratiformator vulcanicus TaxID=2527980 RepID=A0A517R596_9PLAN|nr:tetratricopeptide repeat protein [Stratiformator vulcanicus]QDT39066.1 Anaphase-promoting complex, cyclosome, subunit 3 [Stratiformator vulcanicus]
MSIRLLAIAVVSTLCVAVGVLGWFTLTADVRTPEEQLESALRLIDRPDEPRAWRRAARISEELEDIGFRHPAFGGAGEFIRGVAAFRLAEDEPGDGHLRFYRRAAVHLKESEQQALTDSRRNEWAYAYGMSLYELGRYAEAERPLSELRKSDFEGHSDAARAWLEIQIADSGRPVPAEAIELAHQLTESETSTVDDSVVRLAARTELAAGHIDKADDLLKKVDQQSDDRTRVLKARIHLARGELDQARRLLDPVSEKLTIDYGNHAIAIYLSGRTFERSGERHRAVKSYERAARTYPESDEAFASSLAIAEIFQADGRKEEALSWYAEAVERFAERTPFRNRWIDVEHVRRSFRKAWETWVDNSQYADAVALADLSRRVLGETASLELIALTRRREAEAAEAIASKADMTARRNSRLERDALWRQSGRAYGRIAEALHDKERVAEALWTAATDTRRGGAFDESLAYIDQFLKQEPLGLTASGTLLKGEVLMDFDRIDEAAAAMLDVIENHRTDPVSFRARLMYGQCLLEKGQLDDAERVWLELLTADELTPAATEWRSALFSVARLLHRRAIISGPDDSTDSKTITAQPGSGSVPILPVSNSTANTSALPTRKDRLERANSMLDEFLRRYSADARVPEARVLLTIGLRQCADEIAKRQKTAETENLRQELARQRIAVLERAATVVDQVTRSLIPLEERDRLTSHGKELLATAIFEAGHVRFELGPLDQTVETYTRALNRYPNDPRILLAYVRMAQAYRAAGQDINARSIIEQARVVLKRLPPESFDSPLTVLDRPQWESWLDRLST